MKIVNKSWNIDRQLNFRKDIDFDVVEEYLNNIQWDFTELSDKVPLKFVKKYPNLKWDYKKIVFNFASQNLDSSTESIDFINDYLKDKKPNFLDETEWFTLANKGSRVAMCNYAIKIENKDLPEAKKWFLKAIELGDVDAMNIYACLLDDEMSLECKKYYLMSIEHGCTESMFNYARLLETSGDVEECKKYYLMAIEKGDTDAMYRYANLIVKNQRFSEGFVVVKNNEFLLSKSKLNLENIQRDHTKVQNLPETQSVFIKNTLDEQKSEPSPRSVSDAKKYYLMAIEKGNTDAMNDYAVFLLDTNQSEEAEKYFLMAIEKGNRHAMNNYAKLLHIKTPLDYEKIKKYYLMAIKILKEQSESETGEKKVEILLEEVKYLYKYYEKTKKEEILTEIGEILNIKNMSLSVAKIITQLESNCKKVHF